MKEKLTYLCRALVVLATFAYYATIYIARLTRKDTLSAQEHVRHYCRQILRSAGQELRVEGELPSAGDEPVVYVFDHGSMLDAFVIGAMLTGKFTPAVAKEYMSWPLFGWIVKKHKCIAIDRSNTGSAKESLLRLGMEAIRNGYSVVGFLEGTRTRTGFLQKLKKGLLYLAISAGVKIVPGHIEGNFQAANRRDWRVQPGTIVVRIGCVIGTEGLSIDNPEDVNGLLESVRQELLRLGAREE